MATINTTDFIEKLRTVPTRGLTIDNVVDFVKKSADATIEAVRRDITKLLYKGVNEEELLAERTSALAKFQRGLGKRWSALQAISKVCDEEVSRLRKTLSESSTIPTITHYRRAIKDKLGATHPAVKLMRPRREWVTAYRNEYSSTVQKRKTREFPACEIGNHVQRAKDLCGHDSYYAKVAGLVALTGRRPIEIQLTGSFKRSEKGNEFAVFAGQAKTKGSATARDNFEIPLLCEFDFLQSTLKELRSLKNFEGKTFDLADGKIISEVVHNTTAKNINHYSQNGSRRDGLPGLGVQCYDTRALYCAIQSYRFSPENEETFYTEILGHAVGDEDMQRMYKKFRIVEHFVEEKVWQDPGKSATKTDMLANPPKPVPVPKPVTVPDTRRLPTLPRLVLPLKI